MPTTTRAITRSSCGSVARTARWRPRSRTRVGRSIRSRWGRRTSPHRSSSGRGGASGVISAASWPTGSSTAGRVTTTSLPCDGRSAGSSVEIVETREQGVVVFGASGRIDASNAGLLEERVLGLIARGERRLVLDLAGVDYMSSAGLRVCLLAAKQLAGIQGKLALASLQDRVAEVFKIAGLFTAPRVS